jgi:hypothetical protein
MYLVREKELDFLEFAVLNIHVSEFARFKDFAAFQTLDEFGVFFTGYNFDARVLALCHLATLLLRLGRTG